MTDRQVRLMGYVAACYEDPSAQRKIANAKSLPARVAAVLACVAEDADVVMDFVGRKVAERGWAWFVRWARGKVKVASPEAEDLVGLALGALGRGLFGGRK